ncbi:hypothetical protein ACLB2K_037891 [Fragaria x ananassa]
MSYDITHLIPNEKSKIEMFIGGLSGVYAEKMTGVVYLTFVDGVGAAIAIETQRSLGNRSRDSDGPSQGPSKKDASSSASRSSAVYKFSLHFAMNSNILSQIFSQWNERLREDEEDDEQDEENDAQRRRNITQVMAEAAGWRKGFPGAISWEEFTSTRRSILMAGCEQSNYRKPGRSGGSEGRAPGSVGGLTGLKQGSFSGKSKKPTIVLEAVADPNTWIWHSFFGIPGAQNDITVLGRAPLFDASIAGQTPQLNYHVNGTPYEFGYYLADGIYPK